MRRSIYVAAAAAVVFSGCARRGVTTSAPPAVVATPRPQPAATPAAQPQQQVQQPAQPPLQQPPRSRRAPAPVAQVTTPPAVEVMTTAEDRKTLRETITASLGRAEQNLSAVRGRPDAARFRADVLRVESFLRQAQAAQENNDLRLAREYAQRAEVLAADLTRR